MKKRILIILSGFTLALLFNALPVSLMALEYTINGANGGNFGKATSIEPVEVIEAVNTGNIDRSKNSAYIPPSFGSATSNTPNMAQLLTPNIANAGSVYGGTGASVGGAVYTGSYPESNYPASSYQENSSVSYSSNNFTLPDGMFYSDGSLGTLRISTLGLNVKVYESEDLESLAKGIGHFKSTSVWEGNCGFAGHNRGVNDYFGDIHTLSKGDKIVYTTKLGTRTYSVYYVGKIKETNTSYLQRSNTNMITLITCVKNEPAYRWCVQAREI